MNLALSDPFVLAQDYPETTTGHLFNGHSCALRFNRKGDYLAAGRNDGVVVIFDVETQGVATKLKGHIRQIQSLSWSHCGRYLLTAAQDWKCIIWDLADDSMLRIVRFEAAVYMAELHPADHLKFVVSLYEDSPLLVDATNNITIKNHFSSRPNRGSEKVNEKQLAADAKMATTCALFTASGDHIIAGTNKGFLNIIEVETLTTIFSTKICTGVVIFLRLTNSGRDMVINSSDRIIRTIQLPNLTADPDTITFEIEHKLQDMVNKVSWNHVAFSSTGEYVTASTYNNHDIYIWERNVGSLVRILEPTKEEHGVVEWHPHRPLIVACGLESGKVDIWSIIPQQRWSALAPDFVEVEENVEYIEREDEFDIHPQEEIQKRRLDLEDDVVDVLTDVNLRDADDEDSFRMPVQYDLQDSDGEEQFVSIGRGEMRRKSPTENRNYMLNSVVVGSTDENPRRGPKKSKKR